MVKNYTQVFVNRKPGGLRKDIKPVKNIDFSIFDPLSPDTPYFRGKPIEGGLWTTDDGDTWVKHILNNLEDAPVLKEKLPHNNEYWEFYHLTASNANLYIVDSKEDYNFLKDKFILRRVLSFNFLNWEEISKEYDGICLTERGLKETSGDLYGWEIPQTLWFKWVFENPGDAVRVPLPEN